MHKKFLFTLAVFIFGISIFAQEKPPVKSDGSEIRNKSDFEKVLKRFDRIIENFNKESFYNIFEFKNKKTGEVKKFTDFSNLDRHIFYIMQADKLTKNLEFMYDQWLKELQQLDESKIPNSNTSAARRKDIENYINSLIDLRKKTAQKYENLVEKIFDDFPDEFTEEEKKFTMKSIRDYHDKHKLINR